MFCIPCGLCAILKFKFNFFLHSDPLLSGVTFKKGGKSGKGEKMVGENLSKVEVVVETQTNNNLNKNNSEKRKPNTSLLF